MSLDRSFECVTHNLSSSIFWIGLAIGVFCSFVYFCCLLFTGFCLQLIPLFTHLVFCLLFFNSTSVYFFPTPVSRMSQNPQFSELTSSFLNESIQRIMIHWWCLLLSILLVCSKYLYCRACLPQPALMYVSCILNPQPAALSARMRLLTPPPPPVSPTDPPAGLHQGGRHSEGHRCG